MLGPEAFVAVVPHDSILTDNTRKTLEEKALAVAPMDSNNAAGWGCFPLPEIQSRRGVKVSVQLYCCGANGQYYHLINALENKQIEHAEYLEFVDLIVPCAHDEVSFSSEKQGGLFTRALIDKGGYFT